jgi:MOSC domain-containing protein YiiM
MTPLGRVVRLQVQAAPLKSGEKPNRVYGTAAIVEVEQLLLTPDGAVGIDGAGKRILDVHNTGHAATRYTDGNTVSFGLTSHYARMRERFGAHMTDGCAGENILVETARPLRLHELGGRIGLRREGDGDVLEFATLRVALPCVEFSKFAVRNQDAAPADLKPVLQFLDEGTRGFYVTAARPGAIRRGDELVALDEKARS